MIARGLATFVEVGEALARIDKGRGLYDQSQYKTFKEYCETRWAMHVRTAYRFIDAAKVYKSLCPMGHKLFLTERAIRPLTQLLPCPLALKAAEDDIIGESDGKPAGKSIAGPLTKIGFNPGKPGRDGFYLDDFEVVYE